MEEIIRAVVTLFLGSVLLDSQLDAFAALLVGLLNGEKAGIGPIGKKMMTGAKSKSNIQRAYRFFSNPRVEVGKVCDAMVRALAVRGRTVVVATDWTEIGPLSVLASAIVIDGRALPVYWTVIDDTVTRKQSVEVEHMRQLSVLLEGVHAVHVLDRGFHRPEFHSKIGSFCSYVIRLKDDFKYRKAGEDAWEKIADFPIKRGRRHDLGAVYYTKSAACPCRIVVFHDHQQKDPWILATNRHDFHRQTVIYSYSLRFRVEEGFKDLKDLRSGFGLHGYRMSVPAHLSRLLAVVCFGYLLVYAGGHYAEERDLHKSLQSNTREERELAAWRVGLDGLKRGLVPFTAVRAHVGRIPLCLALREGERIIPGGPEQPHASHSEMEERHVGSIQKPGLDAQENPTPCPRVPRARRRSVAIRALRPETAQATATSPG